MADLGADLKSNTRLFAAVPVMRRRDLGTALQTGNIAERSSLLSQYSSRKSIFIILAQGEQKGSGGGLFRANLILGNLQRNNKEEVSNSSQCPM